MTDPVNSETSNKITGLVAYGLVFTGLALILLSVLGKEVWHWSEWIVHFVRDLGLLLAAVMAGTILHEKLLRDEMVSSFREELAEKLKEAREETAREVHRLFCEHPPHMTGIRKLSEVRRNFGGYYQWVNEQKRQKLVFAGRSVLHRIDADIRDRTKTSAEDVLLRCLKEGSSIDVLFLDPRTSIISRLAEEEGQTLNAMLGDIKVSLAICRRLAALLDAQWEDLPASAALSIRVYDRVPYFAYHQQDEEAIVGFYFDSAKGSTSAAYELVDDETKDAFAGHFRQIRSDATRGTVLEVEGARRTKPTFNAALIEELEKSIEVNST